MEMDLLSPLTMRSSSTRRSRMPPHSFTRTILKEYRVEQLLRVFLIFDPDGSGEIESGALLPLEKARRKGQKGSKWSEQKDARLVEKMVVNPDGTVSFKVSGSEFAEFFNKVLPDDDVEFQRIVVEFILAAEAYKVSRVEKATACEKLQRAGDLNTACHQSGSKLMGDERQRERKPALQAVYREFDIYGDGSVGGPELLLLGRMRRQLGQKGGEWTAQKNDRLLKRIGAGTNCNLSELNFVQHFNSALPADQEQFEQNVEQFMECARLCRKKKIQQREGWQEEEDTTELTAGSRFCAKLLCQYEDHQMISHTEDRLKERTVKEQRLRDKAELEFTRQRGAKEETVRQKLAAEGEMWVDSEEQRIAEQNWQQGLDE